MRARNVTPHVARNDTNRSSFIDERTTRHEGYRVSQAKRKGIEARFGCLKTIGRLRKSPFGVREAAFSACPAFAACNLVRMRNLGGVAVLKGAHSRGWRLQTDPSGRESIKMDGKSLPVIMSRC